MSADHAVGRVEILPVAGIGDIRPGTDLAAAITQAAGWLIDGDVVVVTSKIVSKAEGRLLPAGKDREATRRQAIEAETVRVVASRGPLQIVATRHGYVMAAAGVDASNVARDEIALLPDDLDDSARRLRAAIAQLTGRRIAVVITDSFGRPWRTGLTDVALGVAGLTPVLDLRGVTDAYGNDLNVTEVAVADEVAAAADLVKGKLGAIPVAVVRGLRITADDGPGGQSLVRTEGDLFSLGTAEAIELGRSGGTPGPLHQDAVSLLGEVAAQPALVEAFRGFLAARSDAVWRCCQPGHLTASALVISADGQQVLLVAHRRIRRWVQPGGHLEPTDPTVAAAALREATEETGLSGLRLDPRPLDLDVHPLTCSLGLPTRHFDVRFLAVCSQAAEPAISAESDDVRWFRWDALPGTVTPDVAGLVAKARARMTAAGTSSQ